MAFLDLKTGSLSFEDGLCLQGGMETAGLNVAAAGEREWLLDSRAVPGGRIAPLLGVEKGRLRYVLLHVSDIAGRAPRDSTRQREFLFGLLGLKDPCPDTMACVCMRAPFGSVSVLTQPYSGASGALIQYGTEE